MPYRAIVTHHKFDYFTLFERIQIRFKNKTHCILHRDQDYSIRFAFTGFADTKLTVIMAVIICTGRHQNCWE